MQEKNTKWLVELAEYLPEYLQIVANGFIKTGIMAPLDGTENEKDNDLDVDYYFDSKDDKYEEYIEWLSSPLT